MRSVLHALAPAGQGTTRQLRSLHFGPATSGRKVYIQASLHADEVPPMLVAQHLRERLVELENSCAIKGEIVLVPMANPIGLSQDLQGSLLGRFDLSTGINFNRGYKHLTSELLPRLQGRLGSDEASNTQLIRQACREALAAWTAQTETEALKKLLQTLAIDADIVLDLHCDNQAVLHLYTGTPLAAQLEPLSAYLGAEALLVAKVSGDDPFDESVSRIWWELAEHFGPALPIANACVAATVELRGEVEVDHELARRDAAAIIEFLRHAGHIEGDAAALPPSRCKPTPLEAVEPITAPHGGLLVFAKAPGEAVAAGETIAELIDPLSDAVTPLRASVAGPMFARVARRYVTRGMRVAKIAGTTAFRSGKLLSM
ncbi:succinylglutamate desuccinylase/aspartoacylase family protein [Roseateles violae]|uniref:M14 family metallopeptidase n=1 Tax=Roseateles violae TaxID=3058042 RepID=A0ABT8DUV6_9BURK|nr:succinylglutamate desuccinylase/aspartoacylase family protein [Pelomonas sp. PFR6]MDN3920099.1 M14 family metallopeptidase [Pelomonas sp. PFR6]